MARRQLKVVRLLEPDLCHDCRFSETARVELADGSEQKVIRCRRLDCDNWDTSSSEDAVRVETDQAA